MTASRQQTNVLRPLTRWIRPPHPFRWRTHRRIMATAIAALSLTAATGASRVTVLSVSLWPAGTSHEVGAQDTTSEAAIRSLQLKAEHGDAEAQNTLGARYAGGLGVPQHDATAVQWFLKAARQGNADAQFNLGQMYSTGRGADRDLQIASRWYRKAAEQGHAIAQFAVGQEYEMGAVTMSGLSAPDISLAVQSYGKNAESTLERIEAPTGRMQPDGTEWKRDSAEAARWYRKAAEKGYAPAQCALGVLFDHGEGVKQDYAQAAGWYLKAAEQDNGEAQFNLGQMYRSGRGVRQNMALAAQWYRRSAEHGVARAQYNLAVCFAMGYGVAQDYREAYVWFTLATAIEGGEERTRFEAAREKCAGKLTAAEIAEGQRLAERWRAAFESKK